MLKGHTKIELFDAKTGERTEVHEKDNMVTGTLQNLFSGLGVQHRRAQIANGTTAYTLMNENMPIYTKNFGGIVLFDTPLKEDEGTVIPGGTNKVVAVASGEYSGADAWRGTYNTNESGFVYSGSTPIGFRYVYDFGTDKGNGTISTISLTNEVTGRTPLNCPPLITAGAVMTDALFTPVSCGDVSKPYILFETYSTGYYQNNHAIVKKLFRNHIFTVQNLIEPVTKTAEKTMKITYIVQESE